MRTLTLFCLLFTLFTISFAAWETEEIDWSYINQQGMGIWTKGLYQNSIALDSDRLPHVAYLKYTSVDDHPCCEIWYSYAYGDFNKEYVGNIFFITSVQPPVYHPDVALVLDAQENPHIFVATMDNGYGRSVFHYYKSGGNWTHEPIEFHINGEPQYANTRIKISAKQDTSGYFHVVYSMNWIISPPVPPGGGYRIRYATNKSGQWIAMDAYYNDNAGIITGCDLEMNESDWPSVSFVEKVAYNRMRIKYMSYEEYEHSRDYRWVVSTVDDFSTDHDITQLGETQLEISSQGLPIVSYFIPSSD